MKPPSLEAIWPSLKKTPKILFNMVHMSLSDIPLGHRSYFGGTVTVHSYAGAGEPEPSITIGRYCSIGADIEFLPGGRHQMNRVSTWPWQHAGAIGHPPELQGPVVVGNDVWIGRGTKLVGAVTIGDGAIIGAYSVVRGYIPPYSVAIGNPAVAKPRRGFSGLADDLCAIAWWDWEDDDPRLEDVQLLDPADFVAKYRL